MVSLIPFLCMGTTACSKPATVPSPAPKPNYSSREVKFDVPDLTLAGTFEIPLRVTGKAPAVLLLPGSGPTDRNGNSGLGVKTDVLKEIAEELAKNGIASLRFDKRAIKIYAAKWPKDIKTINHFFCWKNFVDDAKAAYDFMSKQPEVDMAKTGILGHSEGALIALQIGSDRDGFVNRPHLTILLGSTGRPMGHVLHDQIAYRLKLQGATEAIAKPYLDYTDKACQALAEGKPLPADKAPDGLETLFGPAALELMGSYCRIDPCDLAKKVDGPVLVINGEHDTQVSAKKDTPRLLEALRPRGNLKSMIVPNASHNLKSTKTAGDDAFTGPIVPEALALIVKFAKANL